MYLFEPPIRQRKVRNGLYAYQYLNGVVDIAGQKYIGYSMAQAIKLYRSKFPAR